MDAADTVTVCATGIEVLLVMAKLAAHVSFVEDSITEAVSRVALEAMANVELVAISMGSAEETELEMEEVTCAGRVL